MSEKQATEVQENGEVQGQEEGQETTQVVTPEEIESLRAERDRYKAKHEEAEKHRKAAEQKAKEVERERIENERRKAEEEGNHQKLWETEKERADRLEAELAERDQALQERDQRDIESKRESHTVELATSLTQDTKRMKALKKLIKDHVSIVDGKEQYEVDGVTIDKERFVKYIREEYPSLVDGSGMSGGGALGNTGSGAANNVNSKAEAAKGKGDLTGYLQATLTKS